MTFIRYGRAFKTNSPVYIFELAPPFKKIPRFLAVFTYLGSDVYEHDKGANFVNSKDFFTL